MIVYLYYLTSIWLLVFYTLYVVVLVIVIVILTFVVFPVEEFHAHHWFISLVLLMLCAHPNWYVTILNAICNGVFVEGCARWGLDPVWKQIDIAGKT